MSQSRPLPARKNGSTCAVQKAPATRPKLAQLGGVQAQAERPRPAGIPSFQAPRVVISRHQPAPEPQAVDDQSENFEKLAEAASMVRVVPQGISAVAADEGAADVFPFSALGSGCSSE